MPDQGKGSLLPSSAFQPSQRVRIQLLFTQHVLLHFPYFPAVPSFPCFAESFRCLWGEGLCLLRVPRDNAFRLLRCWEMGQGPSGMAVPFVRGDPRYSFLLCHSRRFQCDFFTDCNRDWSKLLRAPSQHFPLSGERCGAFLLPLERGLLVRRAHGLLFGLWRVPLILSTAQGFYITKKLENSAGENTVVRQCGAWRCWGRIYNWHI